MGKPKQILISEDHHQRLKLHVTKLDVPSMKAYVETLIDHAINTGFDPGVDAKSKDSPPEPREETIEQVTSEERQPPEESIPQDTGSTTTEDEKPSRITPEKDEAEKDSIFSGTVITITTDDEDDW